MIACDFPLFMDDISGPTNMSVMVSAQFCRKLDIDVYENIHAKKKKLTYVAAIRGSLVISGE